MTTNQCKHKTEKGKNILLDGEVEIIWGRTTKDAHNPKVWMTFPSKTQEHGTFKHEGALGLHQEK